MKTDRIFVLLLVVLLPMSGCLDLDDLAEIDTGPGLVAYIFTVEDSSDTVHTSLTDALEAWFSIAGEKVEFRLAPLDSKLYAIRYEERHVEQPKPKKFNLYGE